MRKTFILLSLLCAFSAMGDDQVTWLSTVYDFGAFDEDTKSKTALFRFVNTTADSVVIISATATCGCTTPIYDQSAIAPGDTATVRVSYDPSGRPGRFNKQVYVRTSDSYDRTKLVLQGTVIGNPATINGRYPVSMGPLKLRTGAAMMGRAKAQVPKMHFVDGYNMSSDTIVPTVVSAPDWAEVVVNPPKVGPGEMTSLEISFNGHNGDKWGIVSDSIMIAPNPGAEAYALPVIVIVEEDFSALTPEQKANAPVAKLSVERFDLGVVPEGSTKEVTAKAKLTNAGQDPLIIRRLFTEDPGLSVQVSADRLEKGKSAEVRVCFDPSVQPTGIINARITLITNDPFNPSQVVRVVGARSK